MNKEDKKYTGYETMCSLMYAVVLLFLVFRTQSYFHQKLKYDHEYRMYNSKLICGLKIIKQKNELQ